MKIFVTGATGFIGRHFINELPQDYEIFANIRNKKQKLIKLNKNIHWINKNLNLLKSKELKKIDTIIHFASAGVSPKKATWEELYDFNVNCTLKLLRIAAEAGVSKIIMAGSYIEYGLSANKYKFIPPSANLLPTTPYASSKAAAFELAHGFCMDAKIHLTYNRIFSAYGDGQYSGNLWPSLYKAATKGDDFLMTSGEQVRDFIPVKKIAEIFLEDLKFNPKNNLFPIVKNVCSGKGKSILKFSQYWWKKWNAKGKLLPGKIPSRKNEPLRFVGKV